MSFHVGQKVVCVDASIGRITKTAPLCLGAIYTIQGFDYECDDRVPGIYLAEVRLPALPEPYWKNPEVSWRQTRFRPVIERKTDTGMAILRKIADETTKKITERA